MTAAPRRILVIGSGGAGKTTAARAIAAATGLPVVHLDRLFWHAGWRPTPAEDWARLVDELVAKDEWVMDGNYGGTLPSRLARAETAVFLDMPRTTCLWRATRRALRHRTQPRDDVPAGCPDRLTWAFSWWIWRYPKTRRPGILALLREFERSGGCVVVLRRDAELRAYVSSLVPARGQDPQDMSNERKAER